MNPAFAEMAERGRQDLFFFAFNILGYDKLRPLHRRWCKWAMQSAHRRVRLAPRDTYKSTIFTIAFPLWLLIQTRPIIRGVKGCDLRILIANAVDSRARDFLAEIDGHMANNEIFRNCYGDLVGSGERWTQSQKTIATRKINRKEPSLQSVGKGGQLTSAHYDVAIVDDIVNNKDRDAAGAREGTKRWVRDLVSLVHQDGLILFVGTHWHYEDHYYYILEELNKALEAIGEEPYEVIIESAERADGSPSMPDILPAPQLERLKIEKGSYDYAAQYLNKPVPPDSQLFRLEDLQFFDPPDLRDQAQKLDYYGFCDPSLGKTKRSDFSSILSLARNRTTGQLFLDMADLKRRSTDKIGKDIVQAFYLYPFKVFGYESNGFQDDARKEVQRKLAERGINIALKAVENMGDKVARIQAAEFKIKAVRFRSDWQKAYPELIRQLTQFPDGMNDDGPDGLECVLRLVPQSGATLESALDMLARQGRHTGIGASVLKESF